MTPLTDPHQLLVLQAVRSRGIAFSALPDAPVLPVPAPRLARLRQVLGRVPRPAGHRRPVRGVRPVPVAGPAACR